MIEPVRAVGWAFLEGDGSMFGTSQVLNICGKIALTVSKLTLCKVDFWHAVIAKEIMVKYGKQ